MLDLAIELPTKLLLRTINEADKLEVILADDLRRALDVYGGVAGAKRLVALLDRDTFVLTQEALERLFLPLAREAGLSLPRTGEVVNTYEVDFFWSDLKLVVETDGLRYHRTPSAQAKDARRDQTHTAAGYARLRFSHHQVKYDPTYVRRILGETAARLLASRRPRCRRSAAARRRRRGRRPRGRCAGRTGGRSRRRRA